MTCFKCKENEKKCYKCAKREWREKNPIKASFASLRDNAKRRGKDFDLTFEEFRDFCIKTQYMKKKGIYRTCYTIDRKDETKGYTKDNIQILRNDENLKKYRTWFNSHYDKSKGEMCYYTSTVAIEEGSKEVPF